MGQSICRRCMFAGDVEEEEEKEKVVVAQCVEEQTMRVSTRSRTRAGEIDSGAKQKKDVPGMEPRGVGTTKIGHHRAERCSPGIKVASLSVGI